VLGRWLGGLLRYVSVGKVVGWFNEIRECWEGGWVVY
jgi:hypothetical protein